MTVNARSLRWLGTLAVLAVGALAVLVVVVAADAPSATALPSVPAIVAKKLRGGYDIYLRPLPAGTRLKVSQSAAEVTALKEFGRPLKSDAPTFAVLATDKEVSKRQPDGRMRLEMSNRPVWVVMISDFSMMGVHGMTLCAFVDANTGHYLSAVTLFLDSEQTSLSAS